MGLPSSSGIVSPLGLLASAAAAGVFLLFFTPLLPAVKKYFLRSSTLRRLKHANFVRVGTVEALNVYPVKSAKGKIYHVLQFASILFYYCRTDSTAQTANTAPTGSFDKIKQQLQR